MEKSTSVNSFIVNELNNIGFAIENRIQDLEDQIEDLKADRDKWMNLALKGTQESSANMLKAVFAGIDLAKKES